jgi:hypothetical protein
MDRKATAPANGELVFDWSPSYRQIVQTMERSISMNRRFGRAGMNMTPRAKGSI